MSNLGDPSKADGELPVPIPWRPVLTEIVSRLVAGDYGLEARPLCVESISESLSKLLECQIAAYRDGLYDLPDETWQTSVTVWMQGYWDVLVDLYTKKQGASDLVLFVKVYEQGDFFRFKVESVHVP